jgi:hypothetical protein
MHSNAQTVTIRHKEFVREIKGSTAFNNEFSLILQPGNGDCFPWLSRIASHFQQYKWKGVIFHYVPTSGHAINSSNPAIGSVMMQTSYRATDTAPTTKAELLNEYWASEGAPDQSFVHPIECDPKENPFAIHYTRTGDPPAGDTRMMYDLGVTYIATNGMPATGNVVGDLWVTYEVELYKPIVTSNVTGDLDSLLLQNDTAPIPASLFGAATVVTGNLPMFMSTSNVLTVGPGVPAKRYLLTLYLEGSFTIANMGNIPGLAGNIQTTPIESDGTTHTRTVLTAGAGVLNFLQINLGFFVENSYGSGTITFNTPTWTGTATSAHLCVSTIDDLH